MLSLRSSSERFVPRQLPVFCHIRMLLHNCFKAKTVEAVQIPWSVSNLTLVSHHQCRRKSADREILYIVMGLLFVHRPSLSLTPMFA